MRTYLLKAMVGSLLVLAIGAAHAKTNLVGSTSTVTNPNALTLGSGTTAFGFAGNTGDYLDQISAKGYYYAAYLFSFTPNSVARSATISFDEAGGGVPNLSVRIYEGTSFLGDSKATALVQGWINGYDSNGVAVAVTPSTYLQSGPYVLEVRGTGQGAFGGTLSLTPAIPEPEKYAMLLAGLGFVFTVMRRKSQQA